MPLVDLAAHDAKCVRSGETITRKSSSVYHQLINTPTNQSPSLQMQIAWQRGG